MDVEVASYFQKNTSVGPSKQPNNLDHMQYSYIQKEPCGIVYKVHENRELKNNMMFLQDKHCYRKEVLSGMLFKA